MRIDALEIGDQFAYNGETWVLTEKEHWGVWLIKARKEAEETSWCFEPDTEIARIAEACPLIG